jgi:hypothetical protein
MDRRAVAFIVLSSIVAGTTSVVLMGIAIRDLTGEKCMGFRPQQPHVGGLTFFGQGYVVVLGDLPFCVPTNIPKYFYVFWIPVLALDALLCGLAVFRGFRNIKFKFSLHYSRSEILDVLLRDSVVYFIA